MNRSLIPWVILTLAAGCGRAPEAGPLFEGRGVEAWSGDLRADLENGGMASIAALAAGRMAVVPLLAEMVRRSRASGDTAVAQGVARVLGEMGRDFVPELTRAALDDKDSALLLKSVLKAIDTLRVALETSLRDPDPTVRLKAAFAMARLGAFGLSSIPRLERALEDEDERVREAASQTLEVLREASRGEARR